MEFQGFRADWFWEIDIGVVLELDSRFKLKTKQFWFVKYFTKTPLANFCVDFRNILDFAHFIYLFWSFHTFKTWKLRWHGQNSNILHEKDFLLLVPAPFEAFPMLNSKIHRGRSLESYKSQLNQNSSHSNSPLYNTLYQKDTRQTNTKVKRANYKSHQFH